MIPLFQSLRGAEEIPITDPRMTRFWITLDRAVEFVLHTLDVMVGGEIFVPLIPSMNIADMARAIAPGVPHRTVGIRPGEKLHEVLVTADDSRSTYIADDRLVILPPDRPPQHKRWWSGTGCEPGFRYASDTNDQWLSADELLTLIEE